MNMVKFEVEKFDSQNSLCLWCVKMMALLRQQGMVKILEEKVADKPSTSTKKEEDKAHRAIFLFFSFYDGVLRKVVDEEITSSLWRKLESLYLKKSLTNRSYLKQQLYTLCLYSKQWLYTIRLGLFMKCFSSDRFGEKSS